MKRILCRYEMRLGLAKVEKEYPGDLIGKTWTHERWDGKNFVNKGAHWTQDRLQSIYLLLLPRLPPLVGDECWRKWLRERKKKTQTNMEGEVQEKMWRLKCIFCYLFVLRARASCSERQSLRQDLTPWFKQNYLKSACCLAYKNVLPLLAVFCTEKQYILRY